MIDKEKIKQAISMLIVGLGLDPNNENLKETPERVADMYEEILVTNKYREEPISFTQENDLTVVRHVRTYGFCPHHTLPIFYDISTAYLPSKRVIGLSKPVRIIYDCANAFELQEAVTEKIADRIKEAIKTDDVMVIVRGEHCCMRMRGVKTVGDVITSAVRGRFRNDNLLRQETLSLIQKE